MTTSTPLEIIDLPSITEAHETYYDLMTNSPGKSTTQNQMEKLVQSLFDNGLKTNGIDKRNNAPLHLAARYGFFLVVKTLLDKGADPEAEDRNGLTPIRVINDVLKQISSNPEVEKLNEGIMILCHNKIAHAIEEKNSLQAQAYLKSHSIDYRKQSFPQGKAFSTDRSSIGLGLASKCPHRRKSSFLSKKHF